MLDEVDPDDAFEPQVFAAYERVWRRRKSRGGLDSANVLQEEFDRVGYEPDEDEWALWQSAWSAAVPPRRMGWFLTKQVGALLMSSAHDIRAIINDPELPHTGQGKGPVVQGSCLASLGSRLFDGSSDGRPAPRRVDECRGASRSKAEAQAVASQDEGARQDSEDYVQPRRNSVIREAADPLTGWEAPVGVPDRRAVLRLAPRNTQKESLHRGCSPAICASFLCGPSRLEATRQTFTLKAKWY